MRSGKLLPWLTAADIIDWRRPCASVLMDRVEARAYTAATGLRVLRPLADNTMSRIAAGVKRFVLERAEPFIVTCNHTGSGFRGQALSEPFATVTSSRDAHGLVQATIVPFMTAHYGKDIGSPADAPVRTVTGIPKIEPVASYLAQQPLTAEQMAGALRVAAFMRAHGWIGGELVVVGDHVIVDIGMRMLTPRELAGAQGFPDDYILAAPFNGGTLSESDQRHKIGNSVCPPVAAALVAANYRPQVRGVTPANQGWLFEEAAA